MSKSAEHLFNELWVKGRHLNLSPKKWWDKREREYGFVNGGEEKKKGIKVFPACLSAVSAAGLSQSALSWQQNKPDQVTFSRVFPSSRPRSLLLPHGDLCKWWGHGEHADVCNSFLIETLVQMQLDLICLGQRMQRVHLTSVFFFLWEQKDTWRKKEKGGWGRGCK